MRATSHIPGETMVWPQMQNDPPPSRPNIDRPKGHELPAAGGRFHW